MTMADSGVGIRAIGDLIFTAVILAVVGASLVATLNWPYSARLMPLAVGLPAALLCLALVARGLWRVGYGIRPGEDDRVMDLRADRTLPSDVFARRAAAMFAWVFSLALGVWLFGFLPSVPVFVFLYILLQAGEKWSVALLSSAGIFAFMVLVFHVILHVAWLRGQFPWPQKVILTYLNQLL